MTAFLWLDALVVWNLGRMEVAALEHLMVGASDQEHRDELLYLVRTRSVTNA